MSIMSAFVGTLGATNSEPPVKSITQQSITYTPYISEGQLQSITVSLQHWDGSYIYWQVTDASGTRLTSQVDTAAGSFWGPSGNSSQTISFTFNADLTTEAGELVYNVVFSANSDYVGNMLLIGPNYCRDRSQGNNLIGDWDSANAFLPTSINDTSSYGYNASLYNATLSGDNGGTILYNGTSTYATSPGHQGWPGRFITVSAWIKPTAVDASQTIISKELCYKLRINSDGKIAWMVGDESASSWTTTILADAGLVTAGAWAHVVATVNAAATKIYINGVKVAQGAGANLVINSSKVMFGSYNSDPYGAGAGDFFSGSMGEVKMWSYAISGGDVRTEYNTTATRYGRSTVASPLSLGFNGTDEHYVRISDNTSDWNLGDNYTVEWWEKCVDATGYRGVLAQDSNSENLLGFDIWHNAGSVRLWNGRKNFYEPTPGQWNHIAIQKNGSGSLVAVYVNGAGAAVYTGTEHPGTLTNGSLDLIVGARTLDGGATFYPQYFKGQIADIRISNVARYNLNFNPPEALVVDANVKLALSGELDDLSSRNHTITNNGATQDSDFPY